MFLIHGLALANLAAGKNKNTPLHTCVEYLGYAGIHASNGGKVDQVASHHLMKCAVALLKIGANPDLQNGDAATPLMLAVKVFGPLGKAMTATLLAFRPKLDTVDGLGKSALHHAVENEQQPAVELLLEAGICPQVPARDGLTPLQLAAKADLVDIAELLVEKGAGVNFYPDATPQEEALRKAAKPLGLDASWHGLPRMPPLMHAIMNDKLDMVKALLELKAHLTDAGGLGGWRERLVALGSLRTLRPGALSMPDSSWPMPSVHPY